MLLKPQSDYLLCVQRVPKYVECCENGLYYSEENMPEYEVIETSITTKMHDYFHIGDVILINSVPTKVSFDNEDYFLIKEENIIGKI